MEFQADLPAGTWLGGSQVVRCGSVVVGVHNTYSLPDLRAIDIGRLKVKPGLQKGFALYGARDRISPITINGKPAAIERAVVPGFDATTIVISEEWGITLVRGDITVEEVIKLAESVR